MWQTISKAMGPATWAAACFGAVCTVLSFVYTDTGAVVSVISLNLSLIVGLFEQILRELSDRRARAHGVPRFNSPQMQALADRLADETGAALEAMLRPMREFRTEAEFFDFAARMLARLGPGDTIVVACADTIRRWTDCGFLRRWAAANIAAAGRGVPFIRILLEREPGLWPVAVDQAKRGIRIVFLNQARVQALPDRCCLPSDMGVAVVNGERVYLHYGSGPSFYGAFIESSLLASLVRSQLALLEANGEVVSAEDAPPTAA